MWPFKRKEKTKIETTTSLEVILPMPNMLVRVADTVGIYGKYSTVQLGVLDKREGNCGTYIYRDISKKFDASDDARNWSSNILKIDTELGNKTAKMLWTLKGEAEKNHVEWLYEYVRSMVDYYAICHVKDRSIFEVKIAIQIDDMGDEIFNCLYGTEMELFGTDVSKGKYMELVDEDGTMGKYDKQQGFEPLVIKNAGAHRQFTHIGSNIKNLIAVHWKIDLNNIII